jgi:GNAT superfamily N-acetyltransferase
MNASQADSQPPRCNVLLRQGLTDDLRELLRLMDDVMAWLVQRGRGHQWGELPFSVQPDAAHRVGRLLAAGTVTVAARSDSDSIVGAAVVISEPPGYVPAHLVPDGSAYLAQLVTARSQAGHGVGTALMDDIEERARRVGSRHMALDHWAGSPELSNLYSRRGYSERGRFSIEQRGLPWTGIVRVKLIGGGADNSSG